MAGVDSIEHGCYLDENPEHLRRMAGEGTFFVPTLLVYEYHRESVSPHVRARAHDLKKHHLASIQRALQLGVPIGAGTDAGGHGHPKNAGELRCLIDAGLTTMQALRAGTQWAARCLALEREIGTLEKGRLADLVVVHGDPLNDITVLLDPARIELVLKGGAVAVDRRPNAAMTGCAARLSEFSEAASGSATRRASAGTPRQPSEDRRRGALPWAHVLPVRAGDYFASPPSSASSTSSV